MLLVQPLLMILDNALILIDKRVELYSSVRSLDLPGPAHGQPRVLKTPQYLSRTFNKLD
jgi:hypothetical protein